MQVQGLGGADEADRTVQPVVVCDRESGQPELDGPLHEVIGR